MARITITIPPRALAVAERKRLAGQFGTKVEEERPDPENPGETIIVTRTEPLATPEDFLSAQAIWWLRNVAGTDVARRWHKLSAEERETILDNAEAITP